MGRDDSSKPNLGGRLDVVGSPAGASVTKAAGPDQGKFDVAFGSVAPDLFVAPPARQTDLSRFTADEASTIFGGEA